VISTGRDRTAATGIWSCTEGKFDWYYDVEETIVILEGSIVVESDGTPPKRYRLGSARVRRYRIDEVLGRGRAPAYRWP
jgi:uncharacterized cupin superfamily protein